MLHVLIGAVCAIALVKVLRRRFGFRRFGHYGGGYGPGYACADHGAWSPYEGGGERGPYRRRWIDDDDEPPPWQGRRRGGLGWRAIFERLDATPAQEKAIRSAFDDLRSKARTVKDDVRAMRHDLAGSFRHESLDAETLGTVASRASGAVDALRDAAIGALLKVHEALDEKQRAMLADTLESSGNPFGSFRGWRRGHG
jgi:uncharacterized membrane protein